LWEPPVFLHGCRPGNLSGNADTGLVYQSDAQGSVKVRIVAVARSDSHDAIVYPAAVLKGVKNLSEAKSLLAFLSGPEADAIYRKHGFVVP
jgi:molybdate transport system substrate-binding protein